MVGICQAAFVVLDRVPPRKDSVDDDRPKPDLSGRDSVDVPDGYNHTEVAAVDRENSVQHSQDVDDSAEDHTLRDDDPYYVVDWTEVEVKQLGGQKPQDESSKNEVHSYHVDLSPYYTSSRTSSTSSLFAVNVTAFILIWCTAH